MIYADVAWRDVPVQYVSKFWFSACEWKKHSKAHRKVESAKSCQKIVFILGINTHSRSNKMGLQSP